LRKPPIDTTALKPPVCEPKHTFLSRRRHKPAATTAPKAAETLAFPRARTREAPKLAGMVNSIYNGYRMEDVWLDK
jgi:hypothetical protein